jgi:hypothetical protein
MYLLYFPVNAAWAFVFGESLDTAQPTRMGDNNPMFFPDREDAVAAAHRQGLQVEADGRVRALHGDALNGLDGLEAHPYRDQIMRDVATDVAQAIINMVANSGEQLMEVVARQGYAMTTVTLDAPVDETRRQIFEQAGLPERLTFDLVFDEREGGRLAGFTAKKVEYRGHTMPPLMAAFLGKPDPWRPIGPGNTLFFNVLPRNSTEVAARNPTKVWAGILRLLDKDVDHIIHEVTHMLDNIRGAGFLGKPRQIPRSREEYLNDPVEFNAHFQQGMFMLRNRIEEMSPGDRAWVMRSFRNFEQEALRTVPGPPDIISPTSMGEFRQRLTPANRRKFDARLWQTYDFWRNAEGETLGDLGYAREDDRSGRGPYYIVVPSNPQGTPPHVVNPLFGPFDTYEEGAGLLHPRRGLFHPDATVMSIHDIANKGDMP